MWAEFEIHISNWSLTLWSCTMKHIVNDITTLQWIPSHCGIAGNEQANTEAKGEHINGIFIQIAFSWTYIVALISLRVRTALEEHWTDPNHCHDHLQKLDTDFKFQHTPRIRRDQETLLRRLRLVYTRQYMTKIVHWDNPNCCRLVCPWDYSTCARCVPTVFDCTEHTFSDNAFSRLPASFRGLGRWREGATSSKNSIKTFWVKLVLTTTEN